MDHGPLDGTFKDIRDLAVIAFAKNGGTYADIGGALGDGGFEIAAHPHRQFRQVIACGDIGQ